MSIAQSQLTLCDPMGCNSPGSSVHGIIQARILEWVAISCSRGSSQPKDWTKPSMHILVSIPQLIPPPFPAFGNHKFVLYICDSENKYLKLWKSYCLFLLFYSALVVERQPENISKQMSIVGPNINFINRYWALSFIFTFILHVIICLPSLISLAII